MKLKEEFQKEKSKCFGTKILLSSCSLVNLQVKMMKVFQSIFRVGFLKLKLQFAEKGKVKENVGVIGLPR